MLDAHTAADFDDLAAMWSDPVVLRHVGGIAASPAEAWARLLRYRGLWPLLGYGYWAVREAATGRYVGDVGVADFHRDIDPPITGIPEAGWVFAAWSHGQGFGQEAARAMLDWVDAAGHPRTAALIDPGNAASLALAARHRFSPVRTATLLGREVVVLLRDRA